MVMEVTMLAKSKIHKKLCLYLTASLILAVLSGCGYTGAASPPALTQGYYNAEYEGMTEKGAAFIACGTDGRLDRIYEDGAVEHLPIPAGDKHLTSVLAGEGMTIVGGMNGALFYSLDGKAFETAGGAGGEHILGLTRFKEKYYASTFGGKILSSGDGISWKAGRWLTDEPIIAIAADSSCIMAITGGTDILKSEDGENWTLTNYNEIYQGLAATQVFTNMVNLDGRFIVIGHEPEFPGIPIIMYTSDGGEIWSYVMSNEINSLPPQEFYPLTVSDVCFWGGEMLAACNGGRILTYTDCPTCNLIMDASSAADLRCIAIGGDTVFVGGDNYQYELLDAADLRQDNISPEQALVEIEQGAVVIDVRTAEEYIGGHIPGCLHIPVDEIEDRLLAEVPDTDTFIIFYCAVGGRSQTALETAQQLGYPNVFNLGGLSDWPYGIE